MTSLKIAFVIGHDVNSQGAYSPFLDQTEYIYNREVACYLKDIGDVYTRPLVKGYMHQMRALAELVNPKDYDLIIELHFNKYDNKNNDIGSGCEAVIFPNNKFTKEFGEIYCEVISEKYYVNNRGVKEHGKGDRGYGFLSLMNAPAIILEPFFGDEDESLDFKNYEDYANSIKTIIYKFTQLKNK